MSLAFPSSSPCFLSLPPDLHILILSLLPPKSIVTIRQTCKALRASTELRTVWLTALKRVCLANAVPFVTYNFERMTRDELEYAASMPDRFKHAGRTAYSKTGIPMIHAIKERRLPIRLSAAGPGGWDREGNDLLGLAVIPGGRFVLGRTEDALILWDLDKDFDRPCLMLQGEIDAYPGSYLADAVIDCAYCAHYPEESKVRICVSAFSYLTAPATDTALRSLRGPNEYRHEGEHTCFVYELNLAADPPTFTPINRMKDVIFMGFAGSRERIIVESISGDLIGVWDVEQNTAISWDTSVEDVGQDIPAVTDYHVIYASVCECQLAAYRLPPSQPCTGRLPAPSRLQLVQKMDCFEQQTSEAVMTSKSASYNSSGIGDFVVVDVTVNGVNATRLVKRLCIRSTPDDTPIGPPCVLTDDDIARVAAPKQGADTVTTAYEPADLMRGELMVNIAPLEDLTPGQTMYLKRKRGSFFSQDVVWPRTRGEYDICAVTGRVCVGRMDKNLLLVCDFVPPYPDSRPDLEFYASTRTF
ncbi:hypothetical protein GGG16DRAFT_123187 [Schizophyllum commune]